MLVQSVSLFNSSKKANLYEDPVSFWGKGKHKKRKMSKSTKRRIAQLNALRKQGKGIEPPSWSESDEWRTVINSID